MAITTLRVELSNGRFQEFTFEKAYADQVVLDWTASWSGPREPFEIAYRGLGPKRVTYYLPGAITSMTVTTRGSE